VAAELIYLNGVDATTGGYLVEPRELTNFAALASSDPGQPSAWLEGLAKRLRETQLGLPFDTDPLDVSQAGWAIVYHTDEEADVRAALTGLVEHRRGNRTKVLDYRNGESIRDWLTRHHVSRGNVNPDNVPYYVLLVGSPERIPFEFQFDLDAEYCVGRIDFDSADDYRRYAASVVEYETTDAPAPKSAAFFGTRHAGDRATQLSADHLVTPLAKKGVPKGIDSRAYVGPDATKEQLAALLSGENGGGRPAFLFTGTHGLGWPCGHARQLEQQGSLLCHGWRQFMPLKAEYYFAGTDVGQDFNLHGLIAFHFACFGAGTPQRDEFSHGPGLEPPVIAERPFVARLPRRLLSHAEGGALAIVGHVERAWGYSIVTAGAGPQLRPFTNAVGSILSGRPVGYAMKDFNERYAMLSIDLSAKLRLIAAGAAPPELDLARDWMERNDARNYIVLGDPAARLRLNERGTKT
jgi:hypothetical protein